MMNIAWGPQLPQNVETRLRLAASDELKTILTIYQSQIGRPGCIWNESYPSEEDVAADFAAQKLFVWCKNTEIIAVASIVSENELDALDCWQIPGKDAVEIARVAVTVAQQGHSYARQMLSQLLPVLALNGWRAVHLLAAQVNPAAQRTYEALHFLNRGKVSLFGHDYFAYELDLQEVIF